LLILFLRILQEVWLLKRELARGGVPAVLDAYQCTEFDGTTLTATPAWGGTYAVDVVACVAEPAGGTFWIKALNRSVQVCGYFGAGDYLTMLLFRSVHAPTACTLLHAVLHCSK
jgi:hypothetical protein